MLNNSATGSCTTSSDKRSNRAHPLNEILSGRFNSWRVFKTSGVVCQMCKRWFRSRFDLPSHHKSICAPTMKTIGFQARYQLPNHDIARLANLPMIPRHPASFQNIQRANVQRYNSVVMPGSVGDTSAARRYSVPYETQNLQPDMMRHHSGPPPLYEGREINIPWNTVSGQGVYLHEMQ